MIEHLSVTHNSLSSSPYMHVHVHTHKCVHVMYVSIMYVRKYACMYVCMCLKLPSAYFCVYHPRRHCFPPTNLLPKTEQWFRLAHDLIGKASQKLKWKMVKPDSYHVTLLFKILSGQLIKIKLIFSCLPWWREATFPGRALSMYTSFISPIVCFFLNGCSTLNHQSLFIHWFFPSTTYLLPVYLPS